jgi:hypothetical protein
LNSERNMADTFHRSLSPRGDGAGVDGAATGVIADQRVERRIVQPSRWREKPSPWQPIYGQAADRHRGEDRLTDPNAGANPEGG